MGEGRNVYLVTKWKSVASFTTRLLYPRGKCHQYTLFRSLGGPQRRFRRFGEEKGLLPSCFCRQSNPQPSGYNDYGNPAHTLITVALITQKALTKFVKKKWPNSWIRNFCSVAVSGRGRGTFTHWKQMQTLIKNQSQIHLYFMQLPSSMHTKEKKSYMYFAAFIS